MNTEEKPYNRRGWWPSGWSVEEFDGQWIVVANPHGGEILSPALASEVEAIIWADEHARNAQKRTSSRLA